MKVFNYQGALVYRIKYVETYYGSFLGTCFIHLLFTETIYFMVLFVSTLSPFLTPFSKVPVQIFIHEYKQHMK